MKIRLLIANDETGEVYAVHQFTTNEELEAVKDMAIVADLTWDGERFNASNSGAGSDVKAFLENVIEAVEQPGN